MSVSEGSTEGNIATDGAVVWSLVSWESSGWPSVWSSGEPVVLGQDGVLLFNTEPWLLILERIEDLLGEGSEVGIGWDQLLVCVVLPGVCLGQNEDVVASEEWIWVESDWLHDDLGVFCGGLVA